MMSIQEKLLALGSYVSEEQKIELSENLTEDDSTFSIAVNRIIKTLSSMPEPNPLGDESEKVAHLRYIGLDCDWYITEKNGFDLAYGKSTQEWRYGIMNLAAIIKTGAIIDIFWKARPLLDV